MFFRHTVGGGRKEDRGLCLNNLLIGTPVNLCRSVADLVFALVFFYAESANVMGFAFNRSFSRYALEMPLCKTMLPIS